MKLEMIGLNHTTTVLSTRERAAISPEQIGEVAERLLSVKHVEGVVILSTCNRVELYFSPSYHFTDDRMRELFADVCNLTSAEADQAYIYRDSEAAKHLFRVASGLDSRMLGEVQILGQVKTAYHTALELATSNAFLNRVFLRAIECGKMIRHRTAISEGAVSVAYAAVDLAAKIFGRLEGHNILLVGAGDTIKLATKYLVDMGATSWRVSNRTPENAETLANSLGGTAVAFPPAEPDIAWADIVISATSSPGFVITAERAGRALAHRKQPMLFLDLAVPRDIDPQLTSAENTYVYCVDDFKELVSVNLKAREKEAMRAEKLIEKQVDDFVTWYQENRIAPTIQQLQEVLEGIRTAEVENNSKRFCDDDRDEIEKFSKSLIKKVTSLIIANMKHASMDRNDLSLARAVTLAFAPANDITVNEVLEKLNHELSH